MQLSFPLSIPSGLHIAGKALSYFIFREVNKQFISIFVLPSPQGHVCFYTNLKRNMKRTRVLSQACYMLTTCSFFTRSTFTSQYLQTFYLFPCVKHPLASFYPVSEMPKCTYLYIPSELQLNREKKKSE